jgi:hypothetical protein
VDERVLAAAKKRAAQTGRTVTAPLEGALRESLQPQATETRAPPRKFSLRTVGGSGVRPGVDLDDSAALLNVMES